MGKKSVEGRSSPSLLTSLLKQVIAQISSKRVPGSIVALVTFVTSCGAGRGLTHGSLVGKSTETSICSVMRLRIDFHQRL